MQELTINLPNNPRLRGMSHHHHQSVNIWAPTGLDPWSSTWWDFGGGPKFDASGRRLNPSATGLHKMTIRQVPAGSPSHGGDVKVYVLDISKPSLPTPFTLCSCIYFSVMALSPVFHSINSPDNSLYPHSVLPVLFLPHWSFQL